MKNNIFSIACALLVAAIIVISIAPSVGAVGIVKGYPLSFSGGRQITGDFVPNTATDVVATDAYVFHISLSNKSASTVTCTILDKQTTPREYFPTVSIAANQIYDDNPNGRYFQGGVTWSCSAANAVIGEMWWKYL